MKIITQNLAKVLEIVKPGLASKEMIEQSTSFCFINDAVVTYNDEISISCPVIGLDLYGAINAAELYAFISKVKTEEIEIISEENELIFKSGKSKAGFTLQSKIVLPIEEIGTINDWKKLPTDFFKALSFSMAACSRDMSKPVLTCVYVNKRNVQGCDSYRLTDFVLESKVAIPAFLLPANSAAVVLRMRPVEIAEGKGWVHFKTKEGAVLSCRIFEEAYPDISQHTTIDGETITFPKSISEILDRASVFSKRDHMLDEFVTIFLSENRLVIKSKSDVGWFEEKSRTEYTGTEIEFAITPHLLKDILNETTTGKIKDNKLMFSGENWKYVTLLRG